MHTMSIMNFKSERYLTLKEGVMDILNPSAVVGTNSWGGKLYSKAIRGNYVHWYYGHFHQSWNSTINGVLFSMLGIMEFKEMVFLSE